MNKPILYLLLTAGMFFAGQNASSQPSVLWSAVYNGLLDSADAAADIAVDGNGNVYVTGYSSGSLTFTDYLTVKYTPSGIQVWEKRYNGTGSLFDEAKAIAVDSLGNVYVTGFSYGLLSLADIVTIKYDSSGNQLWLNRYNSASNLLDAGADIAVDNSGNVYVTGSSLGLLSLEDFITIKYSPSGTIQWTDIYDGGLLRSDNAAALVLTSTGDVVVTGSCISGILLGNNDYTTIKYNSASGSRSWISSYDGPANNEDKAFGIAVDDEDNIIVSGSSRSGSSASSEDYATVKYDGTSGNDMWVSRYNGPGNSEDKAYSIVVDDEDNIIVSGSSRSSSSAGSEDYATVKYNKDSGSQMWASRYNGPGNSEDKAYSIVVDDEDNIIVTGSSRSDAFAGSEDYATVKYNNNNGNPVWVARYDGAGNNTDAAHSMVIDPSNKIIITGFSKHSALLGAEDYLTIKYDNDEITIISGQGNETPEDFMLYNNFPNPFNPATSIRIDIPEKTFVNLSVFDIKGSKVADLINKELSAGKYSINFDAASLPSGVYFYKLKAGGYSITKKMILLK
jgi:uncharacterized delta-60 repeat protein